MRRIQIAVSILTLGAMLATRADARGIVYIGTDPSYHASLSEPEGYTLGQNALHYVGAANSDPVAYVDGVSSAGSFLATAGFTNLTSLTAAQLAIANLSAYKALYVGTLTDASNYVASAANVQNFVSAGGGLVTEAEVGDGASWTWLPMASLIGHSGSSNIGDEAVTIVAPSHPVMAGLTNAGLSNWFISVHSTFSTPAAGGFIPLAVDNVSGLAYIIATPVPEPATFVLLGFGAMVMFLAAWRRRRAVD